MGEKEYGVYGYSTCSKCHRESVKYSMCDKCYIEDLRQKYEGKPLFVHPRCPFPLARALRSSSVVSDDSSRLKTNRCQSCSKKVGLMGFSCRCGKVFCGLHRYPTEHSCNFDFKTADRLILAKQNPVIKPDKLESRI